ncbi:MAG: hypothetical protein EAZ43_15980 [Betaproteobacteria bacterium]|nr:MAG: hypothetical protein EAZ43_15980 [Betaproteobacteria bacterium]
MHRYERTERYLLGLLPLQGGGREGDGFQRLVGQFDVRKTIPTLALPLKGREFSCGLEKAKTC